MRKLVEWIFWALVVICIMNMVGQNGFREFWTHPSWMSSFWNVLIGLAILKGTVDWFCSGKKEDK